MNLQRDMAFLGIAGLIPFLFLPLAYLWGLVSRFEVTAYFADYSAIILSFLGGIHWWDALTRSQDRSQLYIAMLPSIIAWLSITLLSGKLMLLVLAIAFLLMLTYDLHKLKADVAYRQLRSMLTGIVVGCHLIMLWLA